jgi:hypothetical protein
MVVKFSQQMEHAQRTEKYIRLVFNSYISNNDFFLKSMLIKDTNYFFPGDFQGQERVRIMHQCALCNGNNGIFNSNKPILIGVFFVLFFYICITLLFSINLLSVLDE